MEEFTLDFTNIKLDQLGYVYKDINKQAKLMEDLYNIPKFGYIDVTSGELNYRGNKSIISTKIGFSRMFNIQIELIQWIEGDCLYKEFLDEGREGLHHVSFYVTDLQKYTDNYKKRGIEVIQSGSIGNQYFAYLDTEKSFGIIIELQETISRRRKKKK